MEFDGAVGPAANPALVMPGALTVAVCPCWSVCAFGGEPGVAAGWPGGCEGMK